MSDTPAPPPPPPASPPPPPPPGPGGEYSAAGQPANFGQRLVTILIDSLIVSIPFGIVMFIALSAVPKEIVVCLEGTALCEQPTGAGFGILALIGIAGFVAVLWYYGEFEGNRGATIGRRVMGCKVVRASTGENLGFGRAVGRVFARYPSGFVCYLGYLWMLWDKDSQTWHDKIVDSRVVKV